MVDPLPHLPSRAVENGHQGLALLDSAVRVATTPGVAATCGGADGAEPVGVDVQADGGGTTTSPAWRRPGGGVTPTDAGRAPAGAAAHVQAVTADLQ